ncbi:Thioesterase AMT4 [Colletotrichum siamense]|nr:Thioesterase AMT4 [Colletotrichum siamense]KAF4878904.1 Thioesterase AMT4 [Colletotrichum siamense]
MASNPLTLQKRRIKSSSPDNVALYLIHDGSGTIANYTKLGNLDCDVYGIQDPHFASSQPWGGGVVEMAKHYVSLIEKTTPRGKVVLGGWSFGGLIAFQLAYELRNHATLQVQGVLLMEVIYPSLAQAEDDGSAWPGLSAIRSPAVREKVTKSIVQSGAMMNAWKPPTWQPPAALPAVVLLRAKGKEVSENPHALRFNSLREQRFLGWEDYPDDLITRMFELEGSHLTLFEQEHIYSLTATTKLALRFFESEAGA